MGCPESYPGILSDVRSGPKHRAATQRTHPYGTVLTGAIFLVMAVFPALAAAESCSYNAGTKAVTATIDPGDDATLVVVGGALHFGATPAACGAATTTNTDSISIAGSAGTVESLTLDEWAAGSVPARPRRRTSRRSR